MLKGEIAPEVIDQQMFEQELYTEKASKKLGISKESLVSEIKKQARKKTSLLNLSIIENLNIAIWQKRRIWVKYSVT